MICWVSFNREDITKGVDKEMAKEIAEVVKNENVFYRKEG